MCNGRPRRDVARALVFLAIAVHAVVATAQTRSGRGSPPSRKASSSTPARLKCGDLLGFFVFLDRQGFSPGQIEQRLTANLGRALNAFQSSRDLAVTGQPDCDTWRSLKEDSTSLPLVDYEITADDVKGPFTSGIPQRLKNQGSSSVIDY